MKVLQATHSDLDHFAHERQTNAGNLNRIWGRAVNLEARPAPEYVYPILDRDLVRDATCALSLRFRQAHDKDIYTIGVYAPRLDKRQPRSGAFVDAYDCYWLVKESLTAHGWNRPTVEHRLEKAARQGDEATFLSAIKNVSWQDMSAADYSKLVDLALEAGAHAAARQIAAEGFACYPNDVALEKRSRILAPPKVMRRDKVQYPTHRANRDWLKANGKSYRGRWVALHDGQLLGAADSMDELIKHTGHDKGILLTLV